MRRLVVLIATLALLSACGDASTSGSASPGDTGGDTGGVTLQGRYSADSVDSAAHTLVEGTTIRLTFDRGAMRLQAGCNTMSGQASVSDGRLLVDGFGSTEMGCQQDLLDQDTWLGEFFTGSPRFTQDGDGFTLASEETTIGFTQEPRTPDAPLQNTSWRLDTVVTGGGADGTASSVPDGARHPGIRFNNGVVGWDVVFSTGCNQGHGPVEVGTEVMDFGDLATTRMACPGAVGRLETTFLGVLGRGTAYTLKGDHLTLTAADGKSGLVFVAG